MAEETWQQHTVLNHKKGELGKNTCSYILTSESLLETNKTILAKFYLLEYN